MNRRDGIALLGLALGWLVVLALMGGLVGFSEGMDFNEAPLEDWMGPFYRQAVSVMEGEARPVEGFIYPPSAAVFFVPMAWLGTELLSWLGLGLQLFSIVALVLLVLRLGKGPEGWRGALVLGLATGCCYPLLHSLHWGQMGAPLAAMCAGTLLLWEKDRPGPAAWILAIATGIKLYPVILWVPRILQRRLGRVDWIALLVVLVGLPMLVFGGETLGFGQQIIERLENATSAGGDWAGSLNRQGFTLVLGRALGFPEAGVLERGLALFLLACALLRVRTLMSSESMSMGAGLLLACLPLLPGPCWPHHLGALPICWWLAAQRGLRARLWVIASAVLASVPAFLLAGGWPHGLSLGLPALSALVAAWAFVVPADS
jgi:hypothetical protein